MLHIPMRQQDEYVCTKCGCRWDVDEDPPPVCRTDTAYGPQFKREKGRNTTVFKRKPSIVTKTSP